jgi:hypothetical protein
MRRRGACSHAAAVYPHVPVGAMTKRTAITLSLVSGVVLLMSIDQGRAVTGNAPSASGLAARAIVMLVDEREDLCTATALSADLVLTAAHCVAGPLKRAVKIYQTGQTIAVTHVAQHPRFNFASYLASRATADVALVKLAAPLPDIIAPVTLAEPRRVPVGETLTIAGFGVTKNGTPLGLGIPREAKLAVTGKPGSLQIRLLDPATLNKRPRSRRLHRGFRRAGLRDRRGRRAAHRRRGELVDRAERRGRLRRPHRPDAAAHLSRLDRRDGEDAEIVRPLKPHSPCCLTLA